MCLIIEQPHGDALTRSEVDDVYRRNPDGFGVMLVIDGVVTSYRYLPADAEAAWIAYQPFARHHAVLHWRFATHGAVVAHNVHPFDVGANRAVVHNGILPGLGYDDVSDTRHFVDSVLRPLVGDLPDPWSDAAIRRTVENGVTGSAMVFADASGFRWIGRAGVHYAGHGPIGRLYSNTYAWSGPRRAAWSPSTRYRDDAIDGDAIGVCGYDSPRTLVDGDLSDLAAWLADRVGVDAAWSLIGGDEDEVCLACDDAIDALQYLAAPGYRLIRDGDALYVGTDESSEWFGNRW